MVLGRHRSRLAERRHQRAQVRSVDDPGAYGSGPPEGSSRWLIPDTAGRGRLGWFLVLTIVPPLLAAIASVPVGLLWVFSASAFDVSEQAFAYNLGFWALALYGAAYFPLILAAALCTASGWRLAGLFHTLIWLCLAALTVTMFSVLPELGML